MIDAHPIPLFGTPANPLVRFTVTTVRNMHLEGKVRATEQFEYESDSAFNALRVWLQPNFQHFSSPSGGVLFIAIHPTKNRIEAEKTATALLQFQQTT